ncbi:MAG: YebC/PmpR family DNA-binding transcriptional regulator [Pseudomonadota bacterium]
MAGHSKFKNIQHRKAAQDNKRAKIFTKIAREIFTAAKLGMPDPNFNPRLRAALSNARAANMPKANIDNAIKKAIDPSSGENYQEMRYEGYGPGGVAIIVEALTDNRNRTASEVRSAFSKAGGSLGETGSLSFLFAQVGEIQYHNLNIDHDELMLFVLDAGASNIELSEDMHIIYTEPGDFAKVRDQLIASYGDPDSSKLVWQANDLAEAIDAEQVEKIAKLIDVLEDNDDVQAVYCNVSV